MPRLRGVGLRGTGHPCPGLCPRCFNDLLHAQLARYLDDLDDERLADVEVADRLHERLVAAGLSDAPACKSRGGSGRDAMKRVVVVHKCGAIAELLSPEGEGGPGAQAPGEEARDCPHCEGERRREGAALRVGDGVFEVWSWRDVTPERDDP